MKRAVIFIFSLICAGFVNVLHGQFIYEENCKNASGIFTPNGHAYYTASKGIDAPGNGWLRLTDDLTNQLGYVLAEGNFSSKLGLTVEFDFVVWTSATAGPADGFSVFLFNGSVADNVFRPGAKGGALGYLPTGSESGLLDSYLGIGIDEFGNFTNYSGNGFHPNAITVCGPAVEDYSFLSSTFSDFLAAKDSTLINTRIPFSGSSYTRPPENQYYRRVKVELSPNGSGGMIVNIYLKTDIAGAFLHVLGPVDVASAAPDFLRVGFAGVTGGQTAFHEVRNVVIRTSGNLLAFKSYDGCVKEVGTPVNVISNIYNGSAKAITNGEILDTLPANFVVTDVGISGGSWTYSPPALPGTLLPDERTVYHYFLDIADNTNAKITWTGYFTDLVKEKPIVSSVYVVPTEGDFLIDDNYATDTTYFIPVPQIENIDICLGEAINMPVIEPLKGHLAKWFNSAMVALPAMPVPNPSTVGKQTYYVEYFNDISKCEGDKAMLEINVFPIPGHDYETVKAGLCFGDISTIRLNNLTLNNIYDIYSDSAMTEKLVSITGVEEYSAQMRSLQNTQNYYISVTNVHSCASQNPNKITFEPLIFSIFTDSIPDFKENTEYNCQLETDAESPYFSVISGNLPAGITLEHSGKITGKAEVGARGSSSFTVQARDISGCTTSREYSFDVDIFIPKVFTPNGDGVNDVFMKGFKVFVTDRLGITIFEGNDGWDGTYKGKTAPENIYFYKIYLASDKIVAGYIGLQK